MNERTNTNNHARTMVSRRTFLAGSIGLGLAAMLPGIGLTGCAPQNGSGDTTAKDEGSFDIIVVGAGGAGMTAALSA